MVTKKKIKEIQPDLPHMCSDFYKELAQRLMKKGFISKEQNTLKQKYIRPIKQSNIVDDRSIQLSIKF